VINIKSLNDVRQEKKIELKDMAKDLSIPEIYCSLLLSGRRRMSIQSAKKIAKYYNISVDEVYLLHLCGRRRNAN